jgi:hypothetical protein
MFLTSSGAFAEDTAILNSLDEEKLFNIFKSIVFEHLEHDILFPFLIPKWCPQVHLTKFQ